MPKFAYLPQETMISAWVDGGRLPIRLAISYWGQERTAERTPDEGTILKSNLSLEVARQYYGGLVPGPGSEFIAFEGCVDADGNPLPDFSLQEYRFEDALVLCLSNQLTGYIAKKFGRRFCVAIDDVDALKHAIDEQLGVVGELRDCSYTIAHNRDHFLKFIDDAWQDEHRMLWHIRDAGRDVVLPKGIGRAVQVPEWCEMTEAEAARIAAIQQQDEQLQAARQRHKRPVPTPFD